MHTPVIPCAVQRSLRLIPLKLGQKVVGVLRLRVLDDSHRLLREERLEEEQADPHAQTSFFWTFLDQVTALVERARLQRENLRIEVLQRTDALRAARQESGLSIEAFAHALGLYPAAVASWLSGRKAAPWWVVKRLQRFSCAA